MYLELYWENDILINKRKLVVYSCQLGETIPLKLYKGLYFGNSYACDVTLYFGLNANKHHNCCPEVLVKQ